MARLRGQTGLGMPTNVSLRGNELFKTDTGVNLYVAECVDIISTYVLQAFKVMETQVPDLVYAMNTNKLNSETTTISVFIASASRNQAETVYWSFQGNDRLPITIVQSVYSSIPYSRVKDYADMLAKIKGGFIRARP